MQYFVLAVLMSFFPAEALMPFAGFSAYQGELNLIGVILAGSAGSVFGSTVIYLLVRSIDEPALERVITRYGKWLGLTHRNINKAGQWFDKHAATTVMIGRLVPGVRTAVSVPAGLRAMPVAQFLLFSSIGTTAWAAVLAIIGYELHGADQQQVSSTVSTATSLTCVAIILVLASYALWRKLRSNTSDETPNVLSRTRKS